MMIDPGIVQPPDHAATDDRAFDTVQDPGATPPSHHSQKYGRPPIIEGASGRRARLRHPVRGAPRR
jgi:hypothetical protein